jgi:ribokinase
MQTSARRSAKPRFDVVGFGALNLDHLYAVPRLIEDGGVEVLSSTAEPGGSAANTVYGLAKLGLRCGFVGAVGEDEAGKAILDSFAEVGVDTGGILVTPGADSGRTVCITAGEGQKAIYILPGANSVIGSGELDTAYLRDARHVHVSSFVGEPQFRQQVRMVGGLPASTGVSLALDDLYARRGLKRLRGLLARCSVLFANADELRELTGRELRPAVDACLDAGCGVVVATFGAGDQRETGLTRASKAVAARVFTRRKARGGRETVEHAVPLPTTHRRPVSDTVGAGDAFAAGFLYGLLSTRLGPAKCGALGHLAAGFSLRQPGARRGLPTEAEFLSRSRRGRGGGSGRRRRYGASLITTTKV